MKVFFDTSILVAAMVEDHPVHDRAFPAQDYRTVIHNLAEMSLSGGVVCDALLARAAQKAKAQRLSTLNPRDFLRVWPDGAAVITSP